MKVLKSVIFSLLLTALFFVFTGASFYQDKVEGSWVALIRDGKVSFKFTVFSDDDFSFGDWTFSVGFEKDEIPGFEGETEHDFEIKRDAGKVVFHGKFTRRRGYGDFEFYPDRKFRDYLEKEYFGEVTDKKMLILC